jgi:glyoxylase-like metal-dependent hydrolase (beta-lactamase superfamily II)
MCLEPLRGATGAPAYVSAAEALEGAEPIEAGRVFEVGKLRIEARKTTGHSRGGLSYYVTGLASPLVVVGDALFAGSMGGGMVSWADALANNRREIFTLPDETIICPGHGPLTTVGLEKAHNPCYPEFAGKA